MAAVETSPPPVSTSPGADTRNREPLHVMANEPHRKPHPLPPIPPGNGRLREAPVSPVRVSIQRENWPEPSNADIELAHSQAVRPPLASTCALDSLADHKFASVESAPSNMSTTTSPIDDDQIPPPPLSAPCERQPFSAASVGTLDSLADQTPLPSPLKSHDGQPSSTVSVRASGSGGLEKPLPPSSSPENTSSDQGVSDAATSAIRFSHTPLNLNLLPTSPDGPDPCSPTAVSPKTCAKNQDKFRNSRESDETDSSAQQQSSAATSASSVSISNEHVECSPDGGDDESIAPDPTPRNFSVPLFHYHHQQHEPPQRVGSAPSEAARSASNPERLESPGPVRRHLTPTSGHWARGSLSRPDSAYSTFSDHGSRGRSPNLLSGGSHMRAPSTHSRKSPDSRHSTYAELLSVPYPQQAPALVSLDNSNLRNAVGNNASLLSTDKTLEMYRQNVKKTNDFSIQYSFAVFLIATAQEQGLVFAEPKPRKSSRQSSGEVDSFEVESPVSNSYELVREARQILQRLASGGYPFAQYYLADGFASGLFSKGKEDYNAAFPLFVLAAKHGHAESAYRTALCYEFGWGCRKDPSKAVQFLRSAASKRHPGAMTRLGKACLSGDLGEKRYREGIKWMKLAAEAADAQYNAAPYQLGCLYETGYGDDIFQDLGYAAELFTQAAELGHPEANYRMGDAYEHGRLNCPRDPALSVHFYTGAAEGGHAGAMMGLCAWYMVGAAPVLEKDEEEACEWARRSAELGKSRNRVLGAQRLPMHPGRRSQGGAREC